MGEFVVFSASNLGGVLQKFFTTAWWLIPLVGAIDVIAYDALSMCDTDPPAMPTFTQAEALALLELQIGTAAWGSALGKLRNLALNVIWWELCT